MLVLGFGSNVGDRLAHLRQALAAVKQIPNLQVKQVSPVYLSDALLPENAPKEWDIPHLNLAVRCDTTLEPLLLLEHIKKIEKMIGRDLQAKRWGPRVIDIDILAFDDLIIRTDKLNIPHHNLQERPFALWPLADVAPLWSFPLPGVNQGKTAAEISEQWGSRFTGDAPLRTRQINQRIDMPQLVGILNITPDSFSDGGKFIHADKALQQAISLVSAGADIIDIGAESTAPRAPLLDHKTEWQRLEPILLAMTNVRHDFLLPPIISVDTRHAETAQKALSLGANWINDVTGLENAAMRELIASTQSPCVVMHHMSIPASREHIIPRDQDPVKFVYEWAVKHLDKLEQAGISRDKMIFDPGIGFGKSAEHSLLLIKNAHVFSKLKTRLLLGYSRKSFMTLFTAQAAQDRDVETLAMTLAMLHQPVDYLRVHNVEICTRGMRVMA